MDEVLEFVLAVKAAHREINRRFNEALRPLGITAVQAEAILILAETGPLTVKQLGARIVAEAGNPSRLVDRLAAARFVQRRPSADDRRQVELVLTDRARELAPRIHQARQPLLDRGRETVDRNGLRAATAVLNQLLEHSGD